MGVLPLPARAAAGAAVATPVPARSQRPQTHLRLDAAEGGGASSATADAGAGRAAPIDGTDPGAFSPEEPHGGVCTRPQMLSGSSSADPDISRYYTMSLILGTVALSYGSVPLYKMARPPAL